MGLYLLRRLLLAMPTLVVVYTLAFLLMHSIPGGPWDIREKPLPHQVLTNLKAKYHLNKPIWEQYLAYLRDALRGSLGPSYVNPSLDVGGIIGQSFPVSFQLGIVAMLFAVLVGTPLGSLAAVHRNTITDYIATGSVLIGVAIPNYVVATILIVILAVFLHWLPTGGWVGVWDSRVVIPAIAIGLRPATMLARYLRASLLEALGQDYIRTAKAKGLSRLSVLVRHGLRNALLPVATISGLLVADVITGSFYVETITRVPGMGQYFVRAATGHDYPVVLGLTLVYAGAIIAMNILADLSYALLDPRIRYE